MTSVPQAIPHETAPDGATSRCLKCGTPARAGAKFCTRCGAALAPATAAHAAGAAAATVVEYWCAACGTPARAGAKFCTRCGATVEPRPAPNVPSSPGPLSPAGERGNGGPASASVPFIPTWESPATQRHAGRAGFALGGPAAGAASTEAAPPARALDPAVVAGLAAGIRLATVESPAAPEAPAFSAAPEFAAPPVFPAAPLAIAGRSAPVSSETPEPGTTPLFSPAPAFPEPPAFAPSPDFPAPAAAPTINTQLLHLTLPDASAAPASPPPSSAAPLPAPAPPVVATADAPTATAPPAVAANTAAATTGAAGAAGAATVPTTAAAATTTAPDTSVRQATDPAAAGSVARSDRGAGGAQGPAPVQKTGIAEPPPAPVAPALPPKPAVAAAVPRTTWKQQLVSWLRQAYVDQRSQEAATLTEVVVTLVVVSVVVTLLEHDAALLEAYGDLFFWLEIAVAVCFVADYALSIVYAASRWRYVLGPWGIVDLLAILPTLLVALNLQSLKTLRALRLLRFVRIFKVARALRPGMRSDDGETPPRAFLPLEVAFVALAPLVVFVADDALRLLLLIFAVAAVFTIGVRRWLVQHGHSTLAVIVLIASIVGAILWAMALDQSNQPEGAVLVSLLTVVMGAASWLRTESPAGGL
ncbi:MAG: zinc ribbon domain-containing protein [Chloroflexi bacterium]|nr:zinc ribbon domain-containing protein [Chloroflexota bacterium]